MNRAAKHAFGLVRKIVIGIFGIAVVVVGLVLLVLPGPGVLVCLLGLSILSLEFPWAKQFFERAKAIITNIVAKAKEKQEAFNKKHDL